MTEQQVKDAIRGFLKAWTGRDVKAALSFFAEDAVMMTPLGTFGGISQIERYLAGVINMTEDYRMTETGMGIVTRGDIGVIENTLSGIYQGMKWETPAMCMYQFKNGKIANMRAYYDVLSRSQQTTKGISRWMVNLIVSGTRRGLR